MDNLPNVTVCGGGAAGLAIAADVALKGCQVKIFELSEFMGNLSSIQKTRSISLTGDTYSKKTGKATFRTVTADPQEAVTDTELIMLATPAFGHEPMVEKIAPYLREGQTILVHTGYFGALRIRKILEKHNLIGKVVVAENNVMPYLSKKINPDHVHIYNYKKWLTLAAWPASQTEKALQLIKKVYSQHEAGKNLLEVNLQPGNICTHSQIVLPKAAFFFERAQVFKFYNEVSESSAKLTEAFDDERIKLASALDCSVMREVDFLRISYGYEGKNIYESFKGSAHAERWSDINGLQRVLKEDLCYFFVPAVFLADLLNINVPIMRSIVDILCVINNYDYWKNGITLEQLGMDKLKTKKEIIHYIEKGN